MRTVSKKAVAAAFALLMLAAPRLSAAASDGARSHNPKEIKHGFIAEESLFIGDSLTNGLSLYGSLPEPLYMYTVGMTIFGAPDGIFTTSKGGEATIADAAMDRAYQAVYIQLGVNEIGYDVGTYIDAYGELAAHIHGLLPDANIHIQSLLPVSRTKDEGGIFTKARINAFNEALYALAEANGYYYIDLFTLFADGYGYLPASSTWDGVHLNVWEYPVWAEHLVNQHKGGKPTGTSNQSAGAKYTPAL